VNNIVPSCIKKKLTVVIPVFNEQENVSAITAELQTVLADCINFEILFVDDGSSDQTLDAIKKICTKHDNVFYLSFSRNFGHQNALRAGLEASSGDVVISMDGDLQHPTSLLPVMIEKWKEGADIVFTTRKDTAETGVLKRNTAKFYYKIINWIAEIDLKQGSADFRLMDRKVVNALNRFSEKAIFYRGLISWLGFKQCDISYTPRVRVHGNSKYSLRKMFQLAVDGIISFSLFPLRLAAGCGFFLAFLSFLYVLYALYVKFFTEDAISGWVSIMAGIYFLGGIQLIFLGLFGEYIGKIFMEAKQRPNYIVADSNLPL